MKTILYVHYGDNWVRGSERCLLDLIANIDRSKYRPIVWCNSRILADEVRKLNIDVIVDEFEILLGWGTPRFNIMRFFELVAKGKQLVRSYSVDLIHSNSGAPCQWMVPVSKQLDIPIVAHLHARYGIRERCALLLHYVDKVIGVSHPVVEPFESAGMSLAALDVIHNGVKLSANKSSESVRRLVGAKKSDTVIAVIGSLIQRKGVDVILKALALSSRKDSIKLAVIGDGPERDQLLKLQNSLSLQSNVHFLGERNDVDALLRDGIDILASGAREEVFGLVFAKAGAAGVPVIAPRVGGIPEVVQHDVTGRLYSVGDIKSLSHEIDALVANPKKQLSLGNEAKRRVIGHFGTTRYVSDISEVYRSTILLHQKGFRHVAKRSRLRLYTEWLVGTLLRVVRRAFSGESARRLVQ